MKLGNVGKGLMLFIHAENPLEILVLGKNGYSPTGGTIPLP